jgi:hypothetical protein
MFGSITEYTFIRKCVRVPVPKLFGRYEDGCAIGSLLREIRNNDVSNFNFAKLRVISFNLLIVNLLLLIVSLSTGHFSNTNSYRINFKQNSFKVTQMSFPPVKPLECHVYKKTVIRILSKVGIANLFSGPLI